MDEQSHRIDQSNLIIKVILSYSFDISNVILSTQVYQFDLFCLIWLTWLELGYLINLIWSTWSSQLYLINLIKQTWSDWLDLITLTQRESLVVTKVWPAFWLIIPRCCCHFPFLWTFILTWVTAVPVSSSD